MSKEELIEQMVTDIMEDFDFDKVHKVMIDVNWKWNIGNGAINVPSTYRIMKTADGLLRDVAAHFGEEDFYLKETGGFVASLNDGELTLQFILAEMSVDHRDYINVEN